VALIEQTFADNEDNKMAVNPRQPKIDALLAAIRVGDETVIISSCKGLQLAYFHLIVTQVCLQPKLVGDLEEKDDDSGIVNVNANDTKDETVPSVDNEAATFARF
jgi:hypothetical protein